MLISQKKSKVALLMGYSGWDRKDSKPLSSLKDIDNYESFLMSDQGGCWYKSEIEQIINKDIADLYKIIDDIKKEQNDVVFVAFSGHGDYDDIENYCRRLEISDGRTILGKKLWGLSKRQILICDSCSGLRSQYANESLLEEKSVMALESATGSKSILSRMRYDELCKRAPEQLIRLYASKIGTSAIDDDGGIYTQTLLQILNNSNSEIDIVTAHDITAEIVINKTKKDDEVEGAQIPQRSVPKIFNYLPGVINV